MAASVLQVRCAVTGAASVSNLMSNRLADRWRRAGAAIRVRDLDAAPVPHVTSRSLTGVLRPPPATAEERAARTLSDELIAEVRSADAILIAAPMYNFGIPSQLKAWFDHLMRPGATFEYVDGAPRGLLGDRKAVICSARGNVYRGTEMEGFECQERHLRAMLLWMGMTDITVVTAEGLALGDEARDAAVAAALAQLDGMALPG